MTNVPWLTKSRLENLCDAIFAFAMTLLVLNIRVPLMTDAQALESLPQELARLWPHFFAFGLSFFLLANFWMIHHREFHFIDKTNTLFIWMNIIMMAFIVMLPFSTSLIGEYETTRVAAFFFDGNMFAIGMCMLWYWWYATKNMRLIGDGFKDGHVRFSLRRSTALPVVSLAALGLAFITPQYSNLVYLITPVLIRTVLKDER